ncbi:DUF3750 domain-containing protein [Zobellella maritima]|uniref:DUF3750 domain-containing protein n=1 Tax=Zobellella maritima TaxID=2059725 RepID=UPI000E30445E|nr:DUF3750 domain-containing protein [Zobellella maritima]
MAKYRIILCLLTTIALLNGCSDDDWRQASRDPAGIAPEPANTPEAVIQVYGADAWSWRGWFAIHTWIAVKPTNAPQYTVYEVVGWRAQRGLPALRITQDHPDRYWYGARPRVLLDKRGAGVDMLIRKIERVVEKYPWKEKYRLFPGPNSNTFPAWIARQVPELGLEIPFSAIGSGWADQAP